MDSFDKARAALQKIEVARRAETAARGELASALAELGLHSPGQVQQNKVALPDVLNDNNASPPGGETTPALDDLDLPLELNQPVAGEGEPGDDPWAALIGSDDGPDGEDDVPFPPD